MITNNVIPFRTKLRRDETKRAALLRAVRGAEGFGNHPYDVIWPAREIDRLLCDAKEAKITRHQIFETLKQSARSVSHWERLRIDHQKSADAARRELDSRTGDNALVKKAAPYVVLLEALAKVLRRPVDDVVYTAFENTQFRNSTIDLPTGPIDTAGPVDELISLITEASRAVVEAEELRAYFATVETVRGQFNPVSGTFRPLEKTAVLSPDRKSLDGSLMSGPDGGLLGSIGASWDATAPIPRVPLFRVLRHKFDGPLLVSRSSIAPSDMSVSETADLLSPALIETWRTSPAAITEFRTVHATLELFAELRLVLGPNDDGAIDPMFECGSFLKCKTGSVEHLLTFPYSVRPLWAGRDLQREVRNDFGQVAAKFEGGWHRICGFATSEWGVENYVPEEGVFLRNVTGSEQFDFMETWETINLESLANFINEFPNGEYLLSAEGPRPRPEEIWLGSCPQLQTSIYSGALTSALIASSRSIKRELSALITESHLKRLREREELRAWHESLARS